MKRQPSLYTSMNFNSDFIFENCFLKFRCHCTCLGSNIYCKEAKIFKREETTQKVMLSIIIHIKF